MKILIVLLLSCTVLILLGTLHSVSKQNDSKDVEKQARLLFLENKHSSIEADIARLSKERDVSLDEETRKKLEEAILEAEQDLKDIEREIAELGEGFSVSVGQDYCQCGENPDYDLRDPFNQNPCLPCPCPEPTENCTEYGNLSNGSCYCTKNKCGCSEGLPCRDDLGRCSGCNNGPANCDGCKFLGCSR